MANKEKLIWLLYNAHSKSCEASAFDGISYAEQLSIEADFLLENGIPFAKDTNVPSWIPVSERLPDELPKDNCAWSKMVRPSVDVLVTMEGLKQLYTAWYSYSYKEWVDVREERSYTGVTHWMPLPEPPKTK